MGLLAVPPLDDEPWPTLGPQICDFLHERSIYGPGSLKGEPYRITPEWRALIYRMYEVYPRKVRRPLPGGKDVSVEKHQFAGRRRFKRFGVSVRKGLAKTEAEAEIVYVELHPDGPVRCDGFDSRSNPVGRPVRDPYIPMLAFTVDQVEELAYGALYVICTEGPDADLFDCTNERIIRLSATGRADGKAVPLANSPNARDGARTTLQAFDEPHRLYTPRVVQAHEVMVANLEKRVAEDPWGLYVGTAGEPGQGSIAEGLHQEAEQISRGEIEEPQLGYFYRFASPGFDMDSLDSRVEAVADATGPTGEFGPGQFRSIAKQWDRPKADKQYLERVWLNRWVRSHAQAFDVNRWGKIAVPQPIPAGAFVAAGFDGARFRDSTGIVLTDIETGRQQAWAVWERPLDVDEWEVPESEVTAAWEQIRERFQLWRCYGDPPHWTETFGSWAARWPDQFEEWWTARPRQMAYAIREYREGMDSGAITHTARPDNKTDEAFDRHIAAAGRKDVKIFDDDGRQLHILQKMHPDRKFDLAMCGVLSWKARLDAVKSGARPRAQFVAPMRIR